MFHKVLSSSSSSSSVNTQPAGGGGAGSGGGAGDGCVFRLLCMKSYPFLQKPHQRAMMEASIKRRVCLQSTLVLERLDV